MISLRRLIYLLAILLAAFSAASTAATEDGYRQITGSGSCGLSFPEAHGPHPAYRTEWWYYTGNLTDDRGHRFGFQLTFFRSALKPPGDRNRWPEPASAWRTDQIYLAHAAVTDIDGGRHLQAEQAARAARSLAGAERTAAATTIHLHAWQAVIKPGSHHLTADAGDFSLDLDLLPTRKPVAHGNHGYSRKGPDPEQASCYYSLTRLTARGSLTITGTQHRVHGSAWMDHEFSSAPLAPGITGWDWFSLQLSDRSDIMLYLLRQADGTINPASGGTLVMPSGRTRHLRLEALRIQPLAHWTSPKSNARYPVKWRIAIASLQLNVTIEANLADQEMHTPRSTDVTYWEGSVKAEGTHAGKPVSGAGYVELTGYAKAFDAPM